MQRTLAKVVEKSGLARSMMMAHLKHMKVNGLVEKEELVQGCGQAQGPLQALAKAPGNEQD